MPTTTRRRCGLRHTRKIVLADGRHGVRLGSYCGSLTLPRGANPSPRHTLANKSNKPGTVAGGSIVGASGIAGRRPRLGAGASFTSAIGGPTRALQAIPFQSRAVRGCQRRLPLGPRHPRARSFFLHFHHEDNRRAAESHRESDATTSVLCNHRSCIKR
jgi:hypothetical protein